ncbi:hypothetical protein ACEPAF_2005 [Sanghuangporus sanghuang]
MFKPPTFAIFDTFAEEEGRAAHLAGKIAEALVANAPSLIAGARENRQSKDPRKQDPEGRNVKNVLISALPLVEEETLTPQWYAIQLEGSNVVGILDFSEAEEGRQAHLNGKVVAALFAKADGLFVNKPEIVKVDVVASGVL